MPATELGRSEINQPAEPRVQQRHANAPARNLGAEAATSPTPATLAPTIDSSLASTGAQAAPVAPVQAGHANAAVPKVRSVVPQVEAPAAARPLTDSAPMIASHTEPPKDPPATGARTDATRPAAFRHMGAPSAKLSAVPRGSDGAPGSTEPERAAPRRLAAMPPQSETPRKPTATDAPSIMVLRGGPLPPRYTHARKPQPPQPVIKVVRGARPLPTGLEGLVQPGPLILRVPD